MPGPSWDNPGTAREKVVYMAHASGLYSRTGRSKHFLETLPSQSPFWKPFVPLEPTLRHLPRAHLTTKAFCKRKEPLDGGNSVLVIGF